MKITPLLYSYHNVTFHTADEQDTTCFQLLSNYHPLEHSVFIGTIELNQQPNQYSETLE